MTNDGAMFEFRAKEGVILYTMDIITNYVGYVDIEIYFRRGSMKNVAFHPKAWTKISEFKLYGEGYSIPVRIPLDGGFEEITLVGGELCSFYITSITGPYIQMTICIGPLLVGGPLCRALHIGLDTYICI